MNEVEDIELLGKLIQLTDVMGKVSRVSFLADQAKKRYPNMEMMTKEELLALTRLYLSLGDSFEEAYLEWKRIKGERK